MSKLELEERRLRRILKRSPWRADAHAELAKVLTRMLRLEEALQSYDRAISAGLALLHARRNGTIASHGRLPVGEGEVVFDKLPLFVAHSYLEQGSALHRLGRVEEALGSYDEAIRLQPGIARGHFDRANTLADLKRLDEALASYDRAIYLAPTNSAMYYNRGNTRRALGLLHDALADYNKAIQLKSDYGRAYNNRGATELALGLLDEALHIFRRADV